jgi:hypothetical protein
MNRSGASADRRRRRRDTYDDSAVRVTASRTRTRLRGDAARHIPSRTVRSSGAGRESHPRRPNTRNRPRGDRTSAPSPTEPSPTCCRFAVVPRCVRSHPGCHADRRTMERAVPPKVRRRFARTSGCAPAHYRSRPDSARALIPPSIQPACTTSPIPNAVDTRKRMMGPGPTGVEATRARMIRRVSLAAQSSSRTNAHEKATSR